MKRVRVFIFNTSGSGSTPQGALSINFQNNGATVAYIEGKEIPAGQSVNFPFVHGYDYDSLEYDGNGGNLLVSGIYEPLRPTK